jgi:glucan phosphoethanolaminetransferase (alkaline phosphatase superfamily)
VIALEDLFGLPAHPIIVHAAVVLLPMAAVATVVVAAIPRAPRLYGPIVLVVSAAAAVAVGLAQSSGEGLEERVRETALVEAHTSQAEQVLPWAIAVALVAAALTAAPYVRRYLPSVKPQLARVALVVVALVAGAGATWTIIDVGHSGAKATWSDTQAVEDGD